MPKLDILYRDQWMIAIDKPAGMLVHPGADDEPPSPVVMKVLRDQIGAKVWLIHRLDRPTSGVLIFSLSDQLEPHLRLLFERHEIQKTYYAIVTGKTPETWTNSEPLRKAEADPCRPSETRFTRKHIHTIGSETYSFLRVTPLTGRYHQIRKHLAMSGFPIVGDYRYGDSEKMDQITKDIGTKGLMLHAAQLSLPHPVTGEELLIIAPAPQKFEKFKP